MVRRWTKQRHCCLFAGLTTHPFRFGCSCNRCSLTSTGMGLAPVASAAQMVWFPRHVNHLSWARRRGAPHAAGHGRWPPLFRADLSSTKQRPPARLRLTSHRSWTNEHCWDRAECHRAQPPSLPPVTPLTSLSVLSHPDTHTFLGPSSVGRSGFYGSPRYATAHPHTARTPVPTHTLAYLPTAPRTLCTHLHTHLYQLHIPLVLFFPATSTATHCWLPSTRTHTPPPPHTCLYHTPLLRSIYTPPGEDWVPFFALPHSWAGGRRGEGRPLTICAALQDRRDVAYGVGSSPGTGMGRTERRTRGAADVAAAVCVRRTWADSLNSGPRLARHARHATHAYPAHYCAATAPHHLPPTNSTLRRLHAFPSHTWLRAIFPHSCL